MLQNSETLNIRWDYSFELSTSSIFKQEAEEEYSILIEKQESRDFLRNLELHETKRLRISRSEAKSVFVSPKSSRKAVTQSKNKSQYHYYRQCKLTLPRNISSIIFQDQKCPKLADNQLFDRIYGAFFGFLIGDSIGSYLAFYTSSIDQLVIQSLLMNGGGSYNLNPGQITDDSELAFSLAYGLIEGQGKYNQDLIAKNYGIWVQSKPFDIAAIVSIALNEIKKVRIDKSTTQKDIKGLSKKIKQSAYKNINQESNIGLIRLLPLAIWSINLHDQQIESLIKQEMDLINPNELVLETALVWVKVLHILFFKGDHLEAYSAASRKIYESGNQNLQQLWNIIQKSQAIQSKGNLGRLKTSFSYSFIELNKAKLNFTESLIEVLRKGGDTDSNAAIVCSLIGAAVGYNAIPAYFKNKIMNACIDSGSKIRPDIYRPCKVVKIVRQLLRIAPSCLQIC